jgi:hypothetical protein
VVGSSLAIVAIVAGSLWFVATSVLHDQVLDRGTFMRAFDETGAARRMYSEVLTDGAVRELTDRLFDGLSDIGVDREDAAAVANAALRLALPPAILRAAADALVSDVIGYIRGERDTFDAPVPVLHALRSIDPAAANLLLDAVNAVSSFLLDHLEDVESFAQAVADGLAEGQIPTMVPLVGGRLVAEAQLMTALDGLTASLVPAEVREQVLAAVGSREHRDALIATALDTLRTWLMDLSNKLVAGGDLTVDLVDAVVVASGQDHDDVAGRAATIRAWVAWVPSSSRYAGMALAVAGAAAVVGLHRRRASRAVVMVGSGLLSSGVAVWCGATVLGDSIGAPIGDVAAHDRQPLATAARRLLTDLDHDISSTLSTAATGPAKALLAAGAIAIAAGAAAMLWTAVAPTVRRRAVGTLATCAVATVATGIVAQPGPARAARVCNGHAELCDRPYDEVVQAATHNSMSSPDVVRVWPEHDGNIREQLDYGIRTLMIDASYWDGIDISQLGSLGDFGASDAGRDLLHTIETRLAPRPGIYLCHSQCALGAVSMISALGQIKGFLDEHPGEVVTLMIQDGIKPADVEAAFAESGIDDLLFDGPVDGEWPTLGEMIERGQRLVVFSEQHVPPPAWYLSAFRNIQDTPYGPRSPEAMSCAPNRGPIDAPLFLLNNWIERQAPDRAMAAIVNTKHFIVERARRCERERGLRPNFIAVSFYGIGDVIGAVDELNGVAPA